MSDPTWTTTTRVIDSLVNFKGRWIRLNAIEAILPQDVLGFPSNSETKILLSNGSYVQLKDTKPGEVIDTIERAMGKSK